MGDSTIAAGHQGGKEDRENKRRLFRSESFRAFRSDRKRNAATAHASPEAYILTKSQTVSPAHEESMTTSDASLSVLRPGVGGVPDDGQSFRSECLTLTKHKDDDAVPSPRLLFRSFSAPESGFSFSSLGSRLAQQAESLWPEQPAAVFGGGHRG